MSHDKIRNIALAAHVDAGKTTLCERVLFHCQAISVMGEVDAGSTVMDFLPEEQKRGISITASAISCFWQGLRLNLVDTPGHVDFSGEVERSLSAVDAAIVIVSAVDGVEAQTEAVWRHLSERGLPSLIFINKCDRRDGRFTDVLGELASRLGITPALLTLPLGASESTQDAPQLTGVCSLLSSPSSDMPEQAQSLHESLLERLAEADDTFLSLWLEGSFTTKDVKEACARACQSRKLVPVLCGSALHNLGVTELLSAVADFLPAPSHTSGSAALEAHVFKIVWHREERYAFLRLTSGHLSNHQRLTLSDGQDISLALFRPDAERFLALEEAFAGDIVAIQGGHLRPGDTLTDTAIHHSPLAQHPPVLRQSLEAMQESDYPRLGQALARIADEDPSLEIHRDAATGTYLVSGLGELHLEILRERLLREFGLTIRAQAPQVRHKESILQEAEASAQCETTSGSASLSLCVHPLPEQAKIVTLFAQSLSLSEREACAIRAAIQTVCQRGVLAGWPLCGLSVEICALAQDGPHAEEALTRAAQMALSKALEQAKPVLLSPIMHLELTSLPDCLGSALHLLQSLDVRILSLEEVKSTTVVRKRIVAEAFLESLPNFSTRLRSATGGRCQLLLRPDRFARP